MSANVCGKSRASVEKKTETAWNVAVHAHAHFRVSGRLATFHHPSFVTKSAFFGCTPNKGQLRHEVRLFWLHAKQRTLSERQGPGRERRPKWRLLRGSKLSVCMQNDRIFASLVECVLRRSFSEHWRKNGIDPRPTTYQSRRPTRQGQTVDLLSVRGPKKKAEMLVGALPERVEPRN